jgi:hypothetical protein
MRLKSYLFFTKYGTEFFFINGIRPQFKKNPGSNYNYKKLSGHIQNNYEILLKC